jgi:predicted DNA-binding protein
MAKKKEGAVKSATAQYTMRLPDELREELERISTECDRSLSKQIVYIIRRYIVDYKKGVAK